MKFNVPIDTVYAHYYEYVTPGFSVLELVLLSDFTRAIGLCKAFGLNFEVNLQKCIRDPLTN
jgi:hypothetical protein